MKYLPTFQFAEKNIFPHFRVLHKVLEHPVLIFGFRTLFLDNFYFRMFLEYTPPILKEVIVSTLTFRAHMGSAGPQNIFLPGISQTAWCQMHFIVHLHTFLLNSLKPFFLIFRINNCVNFFQVISLLEISLQRYVLLTVKNVFISIL